MRGEMLAERRLAVADREIDAVMPERCDLRVGDHAHVVVGMRIGELREPRISHFDANDGVVLIVSAARRLTSLSVASAIACSARCTSEKYAAPSCVSARPRGRRSNSFQAEHVLEMAHLLRDGALRDADLVGGGAELRCRADTSNARSAFSGGRREGRGGIVRL